MTKLEVTPAERAEWFESRRIECGPSDILVFTRTATTACFVASKLQTDTTKITVGKLDGRPTLKTTTNRYNGFARGPCSVYPGMVVVIGWYRVDGDEIGLESFFE